VAHRSKLQRQEGGRASTLNATMERLAVAEFADKMQQAGAIHGLVGIPSGKLT